MPIRFIFFPQALKSRELLEDIGIARPCVRYHAFAAILNAFFGKTEITAALVSQRVERAVAEQAVEVHRMFGWMAREKLAFPMAEKRVVAFLGRGIKRIAIFHG